MIGTLPHLVIAAMLSVAGPTAADDQQRVSDALAASSLRMLQAGFWSVGPGTQDDDFVSACLGGVDAPGRLAPMPGEVARGVSNVYLHQPDSDARRQDGELVTVALVAVDPASASSLDWFVVLLGDDDTAACRRDEFLGAAEVDAGAEGFDAVAVAEATRDLGIGDGSARLDLTITFSRTGTVREVRHVVYTYVVSRVGTTLVVLATATFGDGPFSGLDPEAEVAAIAADLAAA